MTRTRLVGPDRSTHGLSVPTGESWMADAACRSADPELFFSDLAASHAADTPTQDEAAGLAVCADCPVLQRCRDYGDRVEKMRTHPYYVVGVIGGETPGRRMSRRRRAAKAGEMA